MSHELLHLLDIPGLDEHGFGKGGPQLVRRDLLRLVGYAPVHILLYEFFDRSDADPVSGSVQKYGGLVFFGLVHPPAVFDIVQKDLFGVVRHINRIKISALTVNIDTVFCKIHIVYVHPYELGNTYARVEEDCTYCSIAFGCLGIMEF